MDLKLIVRALEIAFPMIKTALSWSREHVRKYSIEVEKNTIKIHVVIDDEKNAEEVKYYLNSILEAILT